MSILYPLGLLGLSGIVALIIIYIIKPKYQEKKVSSTFIWKLSLKYYKRKIPLQWLTKSLLFILQVLTILITTLLLTRPYLKVDAKSFEKIIIIENSASMQQTLNNETRFDVALKEVITLTKGANEDQKVSIIICEEEARFLAFRESSPSYLEQLLRTVSPSYSEVDLEKGIELAKSVLDENYKAEVILYSDNVYEDYGYVTFKDMSRKEWNASILAFEEELVAGYYQFKARVASFNQDIALNVVLSIDGTTEYEKVIEFKSNEIVELTFTDLELTSFTYAELILKANDEKISDAFQYDNQFSLYGVTKERFNVEIIGDASIFTTAAIQSLQNKKCRIYTPTTEADIQTSGYDLYIFNNVIPSFIPTDGHLWLINPPKNTNIEALNLAFGEVVSNNSELIITDSDSSLVKNLLIEQVSLSQMTNILSYLEYDVIIEANNNPLLLTKQINKQIISVLNLDVHYSNIALTINLPILIMNLINETLHYPSDKNLYNVNDVALLNFKINCTEASLNNNLIYTTLNFDSYLEYEFLVPGNYVLNQTINNSANKDYIFVRVAENELNANFNYGILTGEEYVSESINYESSDVLDHQEFYLFLALGLFALFVIEWVVQYREQY